MGRRNSKQQKEKEKNPNNNDQIKCSCQTTMTGRQHNKLLLILKNKQQQHCINCCLFPFLGKEVFNWKCSNEFTDSNGKCKVCGKYAIL